MSAFSDQTSSFSSLSAAIESGLSILQIDALLRKGADTQKPDAQGRLPMDVALESNRWDIADLLLDYGAKPPLYNGDPNGPPFLNYQDARLERETALTYMLKNVTSFFSIYTLLANGADVNLKNQNDETPLGAAVARGWPYAAVELAKRGAWINPESPDVNEVLDNKTGATRLICTILQGKDGYAVQRMLKEGADPNKTDAYGLSPLAAAKALKWDHVVEQLLAYRAKPETATLPDPDVYIGKDKNQPLLVYAASYQGAHANYIHSLLQQGANTELADTEGRTAAHWAAIFNNVWLLEELEEKGANLLRSAQENGLRPLHFACMNGAVEAAGMLLEISPSEHINEKVGPNHQTALHLAAYRKGAVETVRLLLDMGADVNAVDNNGKTPLSHAIDSRDPAIVSLLIRRGADVAKMPPAANDNPPLFCLVNSHNPGNLVIAQALINGGADVNAKALRSINGPQVGDSLLYFAIRYSATTLSDMLLKAGADPHSTSAAGESAAHHCLHLRQEKELQLLLAHGFDPEKKFSFSKKWSGSEGTRIETHDSSALECARELAAKFGENTEYSRMLKMIETHIAAKPAPAPRAKRARTGPQAG